MKIKTFGNDKLHIYGNDIRNCKKVWKYFIILIHVHTLYMYMIQKH